MTPRPKSRRIVDKEIVYKKNVNVLDTTIVVGIVARIIGNFTSDRIVPHPKSGGGTFFCLNLNKKWRNERRMGLRTERVVGHPQGGDQGMRLKMSGRAVNSQSQLLHPRPKVLSEKELIEEVNRSVKRSYN